MLDVQLTKKFYSVLPRYRSGIRICLQMT